MKKEKWYISEQDYGTFLMCGNYCVARLDNRIPQWLCESIQRGDKILEEE